MEYSYHTLVLLAGVAIAGLSLVGAIAVGPYGRRGLRLALVAVAFVSLLGSGAWLVSYLSLIEQRRSIETRLSELRAQALSAGSTLACLDRTGTAIETACAQRLFAAPEVLAAANYYTATRLNLLMEAARYAGPRTPQFDDAVTVLRRSLQQDPFGLTANVLMLREGCQPARCEAIALFDDPTSLWTNMREKAFDANVARYARGWPSQTPAAPPGPAAGVPALPPVTPPTGAETRAPIPDKYTLPSAATIPPVSIMNDEPPERAAPPAAKDRPSAQQGAPAAATEQPTTSAPTTLPTTPPAAERPARPQREKKRTNAPLSIAPAQ